MENNILTQKLNILTHKRFRPFHQCAYNNLINFLFKKQNLKD